MYTVIVIVGCLLLSAFELFSLYVFFSVNCSFFLFQLLVDSDAMQRTFITKYGSFCIVFCWPPPDIIILHMPCQIHLYAVHAAKLKEKADDDDEKNKQPQYSVGDQTIYTLTVHNISSIWIECSVHDNNNNKHDLIEREGHKTKNQQWANKDTKSNAMEMSKYERSGIIW